MSIYEQHRENVPNGDEGSIIGAAEQLNGGGVLNVTSSTNAQGGLGQWIMVQMIFTLCQCHVFPVWVVLLGNATSSSEGKASFAVITDPSLQQLSVIARNIREFQTLYEVDVIGWLLAAGFIATNTKPQIVLQDTSCPYPAAPSSLSYPGTGL